MKIAVNTRLLLDGRLDGIGWFAFQTLKRITRANPNIHFIFLFDRPYHERFLFADNITPIVLSPPARHPFLYYYWMQFAVKPMLKRLKPDLFLSPDGFLSLGAGCRQLPVIHDINFLHYPKDNRFFSRHYYNRFFPKFAREATRIATVSQFSRGDISRHYHVPEERIDVVYNGIHSYFSTAAYETKIATRKKYAGGQEYFLFVGSLHPRKNILRLIEAFSLFKKETNSAFKLILAGSIFWGENEMYSLIKKLGVEKEVVFTGRLKNEEQNNVIGSAFALTFVPYFEGFGIPMVEAMQCGTPIIAANTSCLPEIAGEAAIYADPFNVNEIKHAMITLYEDDELRKSLVAKGAERKNMFSWDRTSALLWQSVEKALEA